MRTFEPNPDRIFFAAIAGLAMVVILVGFAPTFYLMRFFHTPAHKPLIHVHGALFTIWPLLLLIQAMLIRAGKVRLHRMLGTLGVAIAAGVVITGAMVIAGKPRPTPAARAFIFTPLLALVLFSLFVATAIRFRRVAAAHKRLMLIATMLIVTAAVQRVLRFSGFEPFPYLTFVVTYGLFLAPLVVYDLATLHRIHAVTLWAGLIVILRHPLHAAVAYTDEWQKFAAWLTGS